MNSRILSFFFAFAALFTIQSAPALAGPYANVQAFMRKLVTDYPASTRLITIGQSDTGVPIEGLAIGNGSIHQLVVATHHGNEYGSTEVAKAFAADLAAKPIQQFTVFVIPVLNTSGYDRGSRWESAGGMSRDPNRDYPGPCGGEGPHKLRSTAALAQFIERENVVSSATLHTFYPVVAYPWGFGTHDLSTPYDDLYKKLGEAATVESKYDVGNSAAAIYPANGTFEDYAFWKHGIWSLLFELGFSHSPSPENVKEMVRVNVPGLRRMLEQAPTARADKHEFTGKCDDSLRGLDRHDE